MINPVEIDVDTKSSETKIIRDGNSVTTISDTKAIIKLQMEVLVKLGCI